ncbi:unnamed protein product [Schistosoma curassoni]|uniref:Uncharacterized protein n=1 Tax=Schistosoma curassoni TaxID=6186 RepID=A0A183JY61_9TREM|nr:unnamed protein product [Schistosoma curassoni]
MNTLYCSIFIVVIIYAYFDMVNGVPGMLKEFHIITKLILMNRIVQL